MGDSSTSLMWLLYDRVFTKIVAYNDAYIFSPLIDIDLIRSKVLADEITHGTGY